MHEDHHGGASEFHGAGGEWRVEQAAPALGRARRLRPGGAAGRHPRHAPTSTAANNEGVGFFEVNQRRGWRWTTAKAFLRPACIARRNFELQTGAQVTRLLFDRAADGRLQCSGLELVTAQGLQQVRASREVVLSAGAIGSPQILQLSGIGPGALLRQHGIAVQHDLPGVGENLQDHLQIRSVYAVTGARTLNVLANSLWGKAMIGLEYAFKRSGPMSMAPSQLGAFTRSSAAQQWPDLEYHVQPLSLDAFGEPLHRFAAITASVCNLNPTSRGTVHITSPRAEDAPAIAPRYLSTPRGPSQLQPSRCA